MRLSLFMYTWLLLFRFFIILPADATNAAAGHGDVLSAQLQQASVFAAASVAGKNENININNVYNIRRLPWVRQRRRQQQRQSPSFVVEELRGGSIFPATPASSSSASAGRRGGVIEEQHEEEKEEEEAKEKIGSSLRTAVVEEYVAAMEEKDARDRSGSNDDDEKKKKNAPDDNNSSSKATPDRDDTVAAAVGVKSHSNNHIKSNAVGDPDGDGSDDDDDESDESDTDDITTDDEDLWEELERQDLVRRLDIDDDELVAIGGGDPTTQVQLEVEFVEDDEVDDEVSGGIGNEDDDGSSSSSSKKHSSGGGSGGVGVRLGQRLNNRRNNKKREGWRSKKKSSSNNNHSSSAAAAANIKNKIRSAWQPYVYLPPSDGNNGGGDGDSDSGGGGLSYLTDRSRSFDGASKVRLDRRTLYAGLLLEWLQQHHKQHLKQNGGGTGTGSGGESISSYRKYLDPSVSQALQSALSLATQPKWRNAYQSRPSGVRLYDGGSDSGSSSTTSSASSSGTLAMQETIAMAMAHSLGAGIVILDDSILSSIRQKLIEDGCCKEEGGGEEVKPAALIRTLLDLAREGNIVRKGGGAAISACMRDDLNSGLDDPFDERATSSCHDMSEWEEHWIDGDGNDNTKQLPLVIFLRADSCKSLLKSKSVVELLLQECNSSESINLIVLGKGIDAKTTTLPQEPSHDTPQEAGGAGDMSRNSNPQNAAPHFGFSPNNQNASGQNDPEGSRRFNIFLARTVDPSGTPGILGAIAPPQAGNLFPHMMAMQARERLQEEQHGDDCPVKADLERWAQQLQQQMQTHGGSPLPPPQFFNASLSPSFESGDEMPNAHPPPPEVIQQTLQQAMSELLDRLAQMSDEDDDSPEFSSDLHRAFALVLRNENIRRGIAENLARAAPALSDPKCQGVMLSVYVPPPPHHMNKGLPGLTNNNRNQQNMGGFFQKILNNQEEAEDAENDDENNDATSSRQKKIRSMAAAAAVMAAKNAEESRKGESAESKADRNLARLEALCRPIIVKTPADPVRAKSWEAWINRERGSVIFRQNRQVLNEQLEAHSLTLQEHVGTRGAGSALRQMLSVRDISDEMEDVIKCAIELEAAKSQRREESPDETQQKEMSLDVDITLSQLLLTDEGSLVENTDGSIAGSAEKEKSPMPDVQYIHPSSLETALTIVCRISPSPAGGMSISGQTASRRSREEISALAQDKHERALVSQVVSPQDIGVTYDMIGGLSDVKELLRQSITYPLKFPHLYSEGIAREAVKGVLLFGPPGTGKTMLAKAVATEGGASFLSVDASSVENKWLGESEKNAKAVFTLARRLAPCVIFIDEVDSLLSSREGSSDDSAHGTLTSVKTTMMSEWDGLNSGTNGAGEAGSDRVIVIGSTNRPFDLDEAVLRRFPRRILVDLPDLETRTEILEVTLAENRLDPKVNLTVIAEKLDGYTGSDIKEVCREAVVQISHEQAKLLDQGFWNGAQSSGDDDVVGDVTQGSLQRLRPVTMDDFEAALYKLKRSVSEKGRELARVWEWNDEYGEIKKESRNHLPHLANMYL